METGTVQLYDEGELKACERKLVIWRVIAAFILAAALALCVISLLNTDRHYPVPGIVRTVLISVLGGWAVITLRLLAIRRVHKEKAHIRAILEGRRTEVTGKFTLTNVRVSLDKGVTMRRVNVSGDEHIDSLNIYEKKVPLFDERAKRVYAVHGFIAAYDKEEA